MNTDIRLESRIYVNGRWQEGQGGRRQVISPTTGQPFAEVTEATEAQLQEAISAARSALPHWSARSPLDRARYMKRIAALVRRDADRLARIIVMEQGKPLNEARGEVGGTAEFFDYFAEFARRIQGEILPSDAADEQIWIQRVPVGVVGAIIPWNYPSALVSRKVAPSMIAGDTIVLKPHEITPLSALEMARIFDEAEVPAGVVNIVCGAGGTVGQAMSSSPDFDLLTMTGSVPTGKRIMKAAAEHLTPVSLELGGKAPFIVMPDCDLDLAVRAAATSRYMNCGQVCICNERTLVHRQVYDEFVERFVAFSRGLRLGDPMQTSTDLGPKVSLDELEKVERIVDEAVRSGAKVALGGGRPADPPTSGGYWYSPTILTGVDPSMPIMQREIFGPVLPIMPFADFDEALRIANASRYGLSAYLYTQHMPTIMKAVRQVEFGEIYVNRVGPESLQGFHVGYGDSGVGGDDGGHGLEAYLRKKTIYLNHGSASPVALMPYGG
jgi:lactaldehyde dehydrogenase/glycolaldehyde dehydrogenase